MTVVLVREGSAEHARRARDAVDRAFPGDEVRTVGPGEDIAEPSASVVLPWRGRPWAIAPVGPALRQRLAGRRVFWTDQSGRVTPCGLGFFAVQGPRYLAFRILDGVARGLAGLLSAAARASATGPRAPQANGPLVLVVAILPDLSHTFIYREILAILEQDPRARVLCLEQGAADAPVHPEAAQLRQSAAVAVLPRRGLAARYASIFAWMLRAPRRVGRLFALYARRPGGAVGDLLGKGAMREATHPGSGFALADRLRRLRPSHVHVYGSTYPTNVVMEAACLLDLPFSISSYVDFDFAYDFKLLDAKFARARFFRVCTQFCRPRLQQILGADADAARIPVVLYGLDLDAWAERPDSGNPDPRSKGENILLSAARLVEKKGLHLLPPALALLRERGVRCRWRVAGDGPELPRLRALVTGHGLQDDVDFLGPLGNDAVRQEFQRTDLAVLPCVVAPDGERDGIPIFLTEAMITGVAVLSTPVSGIPEVVRDGDTGYLAAPGDVASLADRIASALIDPAGRRAIAHRGRAEILATHDVRQSAAALRRAIAESDRR